MKRNISISLCLIFAFGYFLRVKFLPQGALTFGYDQARDAIVSQQITKGDLKILGPPASTPGLYHGVFYYYLLAPAYWYGHGSPVAAAYWIAFVNMAAVFIVFYLAYLMTKKLAPSFLAAIFFAVSFEATQYAVWLSNPTIAILTVPLMYLGLWALIKEKKRWGAVAAGIGLGLSVQAEVFLLYHMVPLVLWLFVGRKNVKKSQLVILGTSFLAAISTMILAEIKFGFRSIGGVMSLLSTQDSVISAKGFGDIVNLFLNQLGRVFSLSTYPGNVGYGAIIIFAAIFISLYYWKKRTISWEPFLATWLFAHITVVSVGGTSTPFLLVGIAPGIAILLGIAVYKLWNSSYKLLGLILFSLIIYGNISTILKQGPYGQVIFAIQKDMLLSKEKAAIDYTYETSNGDFSINSVTSPFWINIVWTYLYDWYGLPKHGLVPYWHGRGQEGQLVSLPLENHDIKDYYLILEPPAGIPANLYNSEISLEDSKSKVLEQKNFGELVVQKRVKIEK